MENSTMSKTKAMRATVVAREAIQVVSLDLENSLQCDTHPEMKERAAKPAAIGCMMRAYVSHLMREFGSENEVLFPKTWSEFNSYPS